MNTNERLLEITAAMPMKQINLTKSTTPLEYKNYAGDSVKTSVSEYSQPYIQRYYVGTFRDGKDLWLHRFLSNDGDRFMHGHPFGFSTIMLNGGYTEEYLNSKNGEKEWNIVTPAIGIDCAAMISTYSDLLKVAIRDARPRSDMLIHHAGEHLQRDVFDWHRIAAVNPETWTAVIVDRPRLPFWHFKKDNGEFEAVRGSSRDWWKDYGIRPESGIAVNDNRLVAI